MDYDLVLRSLQYHGAGLLGQIEEEQADVPLPDTITFRRRLMAQPRYFWKIQLMDKVLVSDML